MRPPGLIVPVVIVIRPHQKHSGKVQVVFSLTKIVVFLYSLGTSSINSDSQM